MIRVYIECGIVYIYNVYVLVINVRRINKFFLYFFRFVFSLERRWGFDILYFMVLYFINGNEIG